MSRILARDPARRCWPVAAWPAADQRLWQAALEPGDLLEPGGARARHGAISNRNVARSYGHWLGWLGHTGRLEADAPPAARLRPAVVADWLATLQRYNGTATQLCRLEELYQAAQVMGPAEDWGWIRRLAGRVRAQHRPVRHKRPRLVSAAALYGLGESLMAAAAGQATPRQRAVQYRDGLVIALLAARPLRRRNLAGLEIGRTVLRYDDGTWWILLPAEETKTRIPLEMPWPEVLVPALEIWLRTHRPLLAAATGRWHRPAGQALWISADGSPMTEMALYDRIIAATRRAFGQGINPHLFRDCAATSIAIEDPGHIGIAGLVLGHRGRRSVEQHYNQAQSITAARQMQAVLIALGDGTLTEPDDPEDQP